MKNFYYLFLLAFFSVNAQSVLWSKMFDIHSINSLGGLSQNSIVDIDSNILTTVVESDILKLYKLDCQGNVIAFVDTNYECGYFSSIVKVNDNDFALIYDDTPTATNSTLKLIHFNKLLEITQEILLSVPISTNFYFNSFFINNNVFYITGFTDFAHIIYYLDNNNELILKHTSALNNGQFEKISFLQNGNFLFNFRYANDHQVRCISPISGQMVWDKYFVNNNVGTLQLEYKTIVDNNDNIYFAGLERTWVSGQQNDITKLKKLNKINGEIITETVFIPINGCLQKLDDFRYNNTNNHFYLSYRSCFPEPKVVLVELDNNFNQINQINFLYVDDDLESGFGSSILVLENGSLIFAYTKFKNNIENGNLYFANLNSNLTINGTTELNIAPKNSSETLSNMLFYDNSKLLITGVAPSTAQGIVFEEVQFFLAMIDVDNLLSVNTTNVIESISISPNPAQDILNIQTNEKINQIEIYDMLGKKIDNKQLFNNSIIVSDLAKGIYFIKITWQNSKTLTSKFIKQ